MSALADLLSRTYPQLAARLVPFVDQWRCALCSSPAVIAFGIIGATRFSERRFGGRSSVAFFLCQACRETPRAEVEDAITRGLEDSPPARGFSLYLPRAGPRLVP